MALCPILREVAIAQVLPNDIDRRFKRLQLGCNGTIEVSGHTHRPHHLVLLLAYCAQKSFHLVFTRHIFHRILKDRHDGSYLVEDFSDGGVSVMHDIEIVLVFI